MRIENTSLSVFYPKMDSHSLRKNSIELEEKLKELFSIPFTFYPIPDEAPEDIPRIKAISHNAHTELNISLTQLSMITTYDHGFENEWDKCMNYVKERVDMFLPIINDLVNGKFLFAGLSTKMFFKLDENPIESMLDKYIKLKTSTEPFDILFRPTFVYNEKYYVNIEFTNIRVYQGDTSTVRNVPAYLVEEDHGLGIILDINDRYGFNYKKDYYSSKDEVDKIIEISDSFIKGSLDKIIKEGVFTI